MAKNVVHPARSSVMNLVPFRSRLAQDPSSWKYRPTTDRATAWLILSTHLLAIALDLFLMTSGENLEKRDKSSEWMLTFI